MHGLFLSFSAGSQIWGLNSTPGPAASSTSSLLLYHGRWMQLGNLRQGLSLLGWFLLLFCLFVFLRQSLWFSFQSPATAFQDHTWLNFLFCFVIFRIEIRVLHVLAGDISSPGLLLLVLTIPPLSEKEVISGLKVSLAVLHLCERSTKPNPAPLDISPHLGFAGEEKTTTTADYWVLWNVSPFSQQLQNNENLSVYQVLESCHREQMQVWIRCLPARKWMSGIPSGMLVQGTITALDSAEACALVFPP